MGGSDRADAPPGGATDDGARVARHRRIAVGDERLAEVIVNLGGESWHGFSGEALWAEALDDGRFLLRSSPFYAFDLAAEDVVEVRAGEAGPTFERVVRRGGGSTYRLFVRAGTKDRTFARFWDPLEALDCNYEAADGNLLAIDVPTQADIEQVYSLLEEGESAGVWEFEEGFCGHPLETSQASWRPAPA